MNARINCGTKAAVSTAKIQGGSNMTGTNCDLFTHNQSRSYLNHLVIFAQPVKDVSKSVEQSLL
jgi:hypothetical protein